MSTHDVRIRHHICITHSSCIDISILWLWAWHHLRMFILLWNGRSILFIKIDSFFEWVSTLLCLIAFYDFRLNLHLVRWRVLRIEFLEVWFDGISYEIETIFSVINANVSRIICDNSNLFILWYVDLFYGVSLNVLSRYLSQSCALWRESESI